MKKNLRIVSAAAAALLAVAPVAASATVANAAVDYGNATTQAPVSENTVGVTVNLGDIVNQDSSKVLGEDGLISSDWMKNVTIALKTNDGTTPTLIGNASDYKITLTKADGSAITGKIGAGQYKVSIASLKIGGLINNKDYSAAGKGSFGVPSKVLGSTLNTNGVTYTETFSIFDKNAQGNPYFVNADSNVQIADKGTVSKEVSTNGLTDPASVLEAAAATVNTVDTQTPQVTGATEAANKGIITTDEDIKKELTDQKVLNADGNVDTTKSFTVTLTAQNAVNGKTVSVKVNFVSAPEYQKLPIIYMTNAENGVDGNNTTAFGNLSGNAITSNNGTLVNNTTTAVSSGSTADAIKQGNHEYKKVQFITFDASKGGQFKPTDFFKAATADNKSWTNNFSVEENTVDSSKTGVYSVTVSAKNANGETKVTVPVVVVKGQGKLASIKNTPGYPVAVYKINDGTPVKENNNYNNLYNGNSVLTFETKTIGDTSYTRINTLGANGVANNEENLWVESDKLSNYVAPTEESVSKTVMYKSALYTADKDAKTATNSGKTFAGYTDHDFVKDDKTDEAKVYTLTVNGVEGNFFKVANENAYVRVRNIEGSGSKMTLKHNAYVYKSNGKRNGKKVIKKGKTIEVYGGKCTMKGYKKAVVRIGVNQYVKVANIKSFKLAK